MFLSNLVRKCGVISRGRPVRKEFMRSENNGTSRYLKRLFEKWTNFSEVCWTASDTTGQNKLAACNLLFEVFFSLTNFTVRYDLPSVVVLTSCNSYLSFLKSPSVCHSWGIIVGQSIYVLFSIVLFCFVILFKRMTCVLFDNRDWKVKNELVLSLLEPELLSIGDRKIEFSC